MAEKKLNARLVHKHDTAANWSKATGFIPKQGEIIVYDIDSDYDYERFKIGDGVTAVTNLEFFGGSGVENIEDGLNAGALKGINAAAETTEYRLGTNAVALGKDTKASGNAAFAEGQGGTASGNFSHAEGQGTSATGAYSHAEGRQTAATGSASHASGYGTKAVGANQTVIGKYNEEDTDGSYAFIVGGGESDVARANIFTVTWDGNAAVNGNILATQNYVGANGGKIDAIKVNDVEQAITDKTVNIDVPTKTSELDNDSGFLTSHQDISGKADKATTLAGYGIGDAYTKTEVDSKYAVTLETGAATSEYSKVYTLKQGGTSIGTINIPVDLVVESGQVVTKETSGEWGLAGTYIELVLANSDETKIYIEVGSLIEYVTSGSTESDQIQIQIDSEHKVTATLKNGSVTLEQLDGTVQTMMLPSVNEGGIGGINWSISPSDVGDANNTRIGAVYHGNNIWVANFGSLLHYSTDGITWTQSNITKSAFYDVYYGNNIWVSSDTSKGLYYSIDGMTWSSSNIASGCFYNIYYDNGIWVASSTKGLYYSTDGKTWTQSNITDIGFSCVYCDNNIWVAGSRYSGLYYSTDGKTWTQSNITSGSFYDVYYGNNLWVAGENDKFNGIYYSIDGITWTQSNITNSGIASVYYDNIWMANEYYSIDGKTWTKSNLSDNIYKVYGNGKIKIAIAETGIYYSMDGKDWNLTNVYSDETINDVYYANNTWVAAGGGAYYSLDGDDGKVLQVVNGEWIASTLDIPTKTSDLTNDSGFITADEVPSGLPAVTTEDASKVLTVDSTGEWAASDLPSDVICLTDSCPLEKVKSALEAFKEGLSHTDGLLDKTIVFVDITYQQIGYLVDGSITNSSTMTGYLTFRTEPSYASDTIFVFEHKFQIDADSYTYSKDMQTYEYGLPSVSTTDEGKVLAVNSSGKWAKTEIPSEVAYCTPSSTAEEMEAILTGLTDGTYKTAICIKDDVLCPVVEYNYQLIRFEGMKDSSINTLEKTFYSMVYVKNQGWIIDDSVVEYTVPQGSDLKNHLSWDSVQEAWASYPLDTLVYIHTIDELDIDALNDAVEYTSHSNPGIVIINPEDNYRMYMIKSYATSSSEGTGKGGSKIYTPVYFESVNIDVDEITGKLSKKLAKYDVNDSGDLVWSQIDPIEFPTVTVDTALSATSENPVQNKVINTALNSIELVATDDGDGNVVLSIGGIS